MAFTLIPKEEKFFALFDAQAAHGVAAAKAFRELVLNWEPQSPLIEKLHEIEHEADLSTHEIKDKINRTFITPFDREDIHLLASELDDIVDIINATAVRMSLYRLSECRPQLCGLADILCQAAESIQKAIACLSDPAKSRRLMDCCIETNRLENEGDKLLAQAIEELFRAPTDPIEVIKWERIYEATEAAIDKCEHAAHTLEAVLVKQG
ncbi:MAG: DUF47 family protein [Elusimicrobiota bacterium]